MSANYSAYSLNFLSGLILARTLGLEQRGTLAFISSFFLITLLLAPLNSRNGSSFASIKNSNTVSGATHFPIKRLSLWVFIITIGCTFLFNLFLFGKIDNNYLIFFSISNLTCGLTFYIYFAEGIYRVKDKILDLAVLRFLGLGVPSFYIFLLFALEKVEVKLILLSQFLAVVSCFVFVILRRPLDINFNYDEYSKVVHKTFPGHVLEYLANVIIYLSIAFTSSNITIGYFAIAMSFAMVADTFFPVVESRMLNNMNTSKTNGNKLTTIPLINAIKEMIISQISFIPLALLIPIIYGNEYIESVNFAIVLILAKCNYAIVKLCNNYALVFNRFDIPIRLNTIYILIYLFLFYVAQLIDLQQSWQIASLISSFLVASFGFVLIQKFNSRRIIELERNRNSGNKIV